VSGQDVADRLALGQIDEEAARRQHRERADSIAAARVLTGSGPDDGDLLDALIEDMGRSAADIVVVNLEDLWLEPRPHNVPGTSTERPNWRRPAAHAVDALDDVPRAAATLGRLRAARNGKDPAAAPS
jgi:4-alpha-glucanotransferase